MSLGEEGLFRSIVDKEFSEEDLEGLVERTASNPYYTEPVQPSRETLIETFHLLLEGLSDRDWDFIRGRFGDAILPQLSVSPCDEVMIDQARVFIDGSGPGEIIEGNKVFGHFLGFLPDDAFFVDENGDDDPVMTPTGDLGLYVALGTASVEIADGERVELGNAHISLSNGTPSLHIVHYA